MASDAPWGWMKRVLAVLTLGLALLLAPTASAELLVTPIPDADDNPTLFNEIVNTINEVAREFPEVRGTTITTEILMPGAYAVTYNPQKVIEFNELYSSDATLLPEMVAEDVKGGFHPLLGRCSAAQFLAYHEAAHVIHRQRGSVATNVLLQRYGRNGAPLKVALSRYSFDSFGDINPPEALAEAFASVKCNGGNPGEQDLYDILVKTA